MNIEDIIKIKENGGLLSYEQIDYVVKSYMNQSINDDMMALFLKSIMDKGLSVEETYYLTLSMVNSGDILDLSMINKVIVDKHSTGGVGDKMTLIISPIVASLGIAVAKMSGKSLGLTGGTIDKLESINGYNVNLSKEEFIKSVNDVGVAIVSQSDNLAVADKKIYALRDERGLVSSVPLIVSSILSKKIASGSDKIVIDLKVGAGAFMKNMDEARQLSTYLIEVAKKFNKKVVCILTDMNMPIGKSVGNALEVKEVIDFFDGIYDERLYELAITLSSYMVKISLNVSIEEATSMVKQALENNLAKDKFYEWIGNQGGNVKSLKDFSKKVAIKSLKDGYINNVDANKVASLVHSLGAGRKTKNSYIDYAVGFVNNKSINERVLRNDILGTVYYNEQIPNMEEEFRNVYTISSDIVNENPIVLEVIE